MTGLTRAGLDRLRRQGHGWILEWGGEAGPGQLVGGIEAGADLVVFAGCRRCGGRPSEQEPQVRIGWGVAGEG